MFISFQFQVVCVQAVCAFGRRGGCLDLITKVDCVNCDLHNIPRLTVNKLPETLMLAFDYWQFKNNFKFQRNTIITIINCTKMQVACI